MSASLANNNYVAAVHAIIEGTTLPIDICSVCQGDDRYYGFASLEWALLYFFLSLYNSSRADIDLNSENMRFLGQLRFDVKGIGLILDNKTYSGRISFLEANQNDITVSKVQQVPDKDDKVLGPKRLYRIKLESCLICLSSTS